MTKKLEVNATRQLRERILKPIVLVGIMGTGKSTIGRKLARKLQLPFHDSDQMIEARESLSVVDIFDFKGEEYFVRQERIVIPEILKYGKTVPSTGGNSFIDPKVRQVIKSKSISIWLKTDFETLYKRISRRKTRPHFNNERRYEILKRLIEEQYPIYQEADIIIDTNDMETFQITDLILARLLRFLHEE